MDWLIQQFFEFFRAPFDMKIRFSIFYLCSTVVIVYGIWHWRGRPTSFAAFLLPKDVYTHRSNLLDIKVFLANRVMALGGLFGPLVFAPVTAAWVLSLLTGAPEAGGPSGGTTWAKVLISTLIIVVTADFCKYWAHRFHHDIPTLWPYHALHHSAEVLTPLTVSRVHPVEIAMRTLFISVLVGAMQGLMLALFVGELSILTIGGANVAYVVFNALGSNLRHSHIWLSYGPVMEHIFISPAQHQIHHSRAVKHHNKNYGSIFALWDWMFGTLYIPNGYEKLEYGVSDAKGQEIEQPYETLGSAMLKPFAESWAAWRGKPAESTQVGALRNKREFDPMQDPAE